MALEEEGARNVRGGGWERANFFGLFYPVVRGILYNFQCHLCCARETSQAVDLRGLLRNAVKQILRLENLDSAKTGARYAGSVGSCKQALLPNSGKVHQRQD